MKTYPKKRKQANSYETKRTIPLEGAGGYNDNPSHSKSKRAEWSDPKRTEIELAQSNTVVKFQKRKIKEVDKLSATVSEDAVGKLVTKGTKEEIKANLRKNATNKNLEYNPTVKLDVNSSAMTKQRWTRRTRQTQRKQIEQDEDEEQEAEEGGEEDGEGGDGDGMEDELLEAFSSMTEWHRKVPIAGHIKAAKRVSEEVSDTANNEGVATNSNEATKIAAKTGSTIESSALTATASGPVTLAASEVDQDEFGEALKKMTGWFLPEGTDKAVTTAKISSARALCTSATDLQTITEEIEQGKPPDAATTSNAEPNVGDVKVAVR